MTGEPPFSDSAGGVHEIVISVPLAETVVREVGGAGKADAIKVAISESID